MGRMEPEYVLTTAEGASSAPRSFIMDSINVDAQHTGQANVDGLAVPAARDLSKQQNNNQTDVPLLRENAQPDKDIRAW